MYFVRTAGERDLEKVRGLLVESFHTTYDGLHGKAKVADLIAHLFSPAALKARLVRKDAEFLVADEGRNIGGMGYAAMSQALTKTVMLHLLYVRPALQRQGIGRDIFAELETCFPDAEIMRLEVEPQNAAAIAFYRTHGFTEIGRNENDGISQSGIPALVLEKRLVG
ncbi:GNAT family N-acetyltransferase [Rhizobium leguminosarum]|uniref:GNAT family N-acetyltransferase n=1 Tax=Rhizobium leguminosarum TaxID=384 RepID=UPI00102FFEAB|nr:GNAT family N-acetyltransferase [Rhizobium leguminosarum]TAV89247.1 GNAT family N-acetyltransferase [Rhizobium leguminosarum]TAV93826.1 GNAT family N-acetyltransferase [Rhizobium leguminosarum]TAW34902.1 GNAT family N-acetyltransferase [Rhizobium leguminosarum]TAX29795.1 GNAT family N-acetyltransferase [Rhizobium leguminosarum]TAY32625.1 GNAT family N-acetyltransferase [Rhizobium leguminosarum]